MSLNVMLTEEWQDVIEQRVQSGRYASAADVISDALSLLNERDLHSPENTAWLKCAYEEGLASGDFAPLDIEDIKSEGRARKASR